MRVVNEGNLFPRALQSFTISVHSPSPSVFTEVKGLKCLVNVGNPLPLVPPFIHIREFTGKAPFMPGIWGILS